MAEVAVSASRLYVAMGRVVALQGLSLEVHRGEFLAVVGPSGSGKSTLLRCLAGAQRPMSGDLRAFGVRLHDASDRAVTAYRSEHVGFVGQHYTRTLSQDLVAEEIVALGPQLRGATRAAAVSRARALLERVGLGAHLSARRVELSGGQQQRVALCAALARRPDLVLADESTGDLDERSGGEVLALLRELTEEDGSTVVLVTHDPRAASAADRTVTVRDGRVTAEVGEGRRRTLIDETGLLRFEPDELQAAGIGDRVELVAVEDGLLLRGSREPATPLPPPDPRPALTGATVAQVNGAGRSYGGVQALAPRTESFAAGELVAVSGPSGSGKTTLLHVLAGLERPSAGSVVVLGRDLSGLDREALARFRREHVAFVPQASALTPFLSVEENVRLLLPRRAGAAAARSAIAAVGLAEVAGRPVGELSGGERQRAAIARAVASRADLLLADEPTANLDQRNAIGVAALLRSLVRESGACVIVTTHDPDVSHAADRVVNLR